MQATSTDPFPPPPAAPSHVLDDLTTFLVAEIAALPKTAASHLHSDYTGQATGVAPFYVGRRPEPRDCVVVSRHPNSVDAAVGQKLDVLGKPEGLSVRFYGQFPADQREQLAALFNRFAAERSLEIFQAADFIRMSAI